MRMEERFRGLLESVPDAIVIVNSRGEIDMVNSQAERLFGYARQELLGRPVEMLVPERFQTQHREHRTRYFAEAQVRPMGVKLDLYARRRDGSEFPVEISLSPVDGEETLVTAVIRDISERKREAEALARSNTELKQFAYFASHDLQEPLRAVGGFCQLLAEKYHGQLDAQGQQWLGYIVDGAKHMQALVEGLLRFSRVEAEGKAFVAGPAADIVAEGVRNLDAMIRESGAEITCGELPSLQADPWQLVTVFQNLIGNAIKFRSKEPPRIRVSAERNGTDWVFQVRDNGIGIDPKHHDRIFVMFQRLHRREVYPGTGIGLALCKRIVERHGGRIWLHSEPGKGSAFFFSIPAAQGKSS
jgi:PAS domain S-box-containing protein